MPYKVARHPRTGKWYVVGKAGNYYMPVRGPYDTYQEAKAMMIHQQKADRAMKAELYTWDGKTAY